ESDIQLYGGLKLTEAARPVLRGEQDIWLRRDAEVSSRKTSKIERASRAKEAFAGANDDPLWLLLKAKRMELAKEQGVPPYVIFHDSTLLEILNQKPQTLDEMGRISGIGQAKLARYGDAFLKEIENATNGAG
ncbi:MAG TPA: HRDC domain-containing protein, partial [Methylophilaceae bacterium]